MRAFKTTPMTALCFVVLATAAFAGTPKAPKAPKSGTICPADTVQAGSLCVDRYEASVWSVPATNTSLMARVKAGAVTLADLTAGGATQMGAATGACTGNEYPVEFPRNGNWTAPLFALSIPGVPPSACISWYQATQACALSGKRLLRNEEWQLAAAGTPDPGPTDDGVAQCNVAGTMAAGTGARTLCVSSWLAADMIGNLAEWTATWDENADGCSDLTGEFGGGEQCFGGDPGGNRVFGLVRGGSYLSEEKASTFTLWTFNVEAQSREIGFRCGR